MAGVDWEKGLPLDILAIVAQSSSWQTLQGMQNMRVVCKYWQQGFEMAITRLRIGKRSWHSGRNLIRPPTDGTFARRFPALTELDLGKCEMTEKQLVCLQGMTQLRSLVITDDVDEEEGYFYGIGVCSELTGTGLQHLRGVPLTSVDLFGCGELTDVGLRNLRRMPITTLNLRCCKRLTNAGLRYLEDKPMPLADLNLVNCDFSDEGLKALRDLPLTSLKLRNNCRITDDGLRSLENLPLTKLDVSYLGITDRGLGFFRAMPLTDLCMSSCHEVCDAGLRVLLGLPIKFLDVSGCYRLTDSGLEHLGQLSDLSTLRLRYLVNLTEAGISSLKGAPLTDLNLKSSRVSGDVLLHLKGFSQLKCLSLNGWDTIKDEDLENIANLPLERLDISGCKHITATGVGHLSGLNLSFLFMRSCEELAIACAKENFPEFQVKTAAYDAYYDPDDTLEHYY